MAVTQRNGGPAVPRTLPRRMILGAALLAGAPGCTAPLPPMTRPDTANEARTLLAESASAHGAAALAGLTDVNVRYDGAWRGIVGRLVPALVDDRFRGGSEERLLLRDGVTAQAHTGPAGRKQVLRTADGVRVWYNGVESADADLRAASALVADGYGIFLLGPMRLQRLPARLELGAPDGITVAGRDHACDVVRMRLAPGLGLSAVDELAVYIDRAERLMRRVRFSLEGLDATQGAVAEVDCWDHVPHAGIRWPTGFHERLLRPLPIAVHDWRLTGLDVNRGLTLADVSGPALLGRAAAAAGSARDA